MRTCFYLMIALLLALPGCGGGGDEKAPPVSPDQSATALESVRIQQENLSQAAGLSATLTLEGSYSDGTSNEITEGVIWESSRPEIVTVSNGKVTCLAPGEAEITATIQDQSDTVTFIVTDAVLETVRIPEEGLSQAAGLSRTLTLEGIFSDGTSQRITEGVDWQSSDIDIATVSDGVVRCLAPGDVEITATYQGQPATATFTVTDAVLESVRIPEEELSHPAGLSKTLSLEGVYSNGTSQGIVGDIIWQSSNTEIATVSNGIVTCLAPGDVNITATFQGHSDTVIITVSDAQLEAIDITPWDWELNPYIQLQYTAYGLYSDGETRSITDLVLWSSSDSSIAAISSTEGSKGLVTANAPGVVSISAELEGIVAQTGLAVKDTVPHSLAVDLMDPEYPINHSFPFTAKCLFSDGTYGDVTKLANWTSSAPQIATVNNSTQKGLVTSYETQGVAEITAAWNADDREFSRTSTVTVYEITDLELYFEKNAEQWPLYPLPEICDGAYCIEKASPEPTDEIFTYKRYKLKVNRDLVLTDIRAEAVGIEEGYVDTEAWFNWSQGFQPVGGKLALQAGDELFFTLESNRPEAWDTAKLQWSFGIEGKEGIDGKQFLMTLYLRPR